MNSTNSSRVGLSAMNDAIKAELEWAATSFASRLTIAVIGTIGNLGLLMAVVRDRSTRMSTRILIGNIAISSLLLMAVAQPGLGAFLYGRIQSGACPFFAFYSILLSATSWADVALAANRVVAVSYPFQYERMASTKVACFMTVIVWSIGFLIVGLILHDVGVHYQEFTVGICLPKIVSGWGVFLTMAINPLPVVISGLASLQILATVMSHCREKRLVKPAILRQRNTRKKRMVLAKAMMASFAWCFFSTMPFVCIVVFFPKTLTSYPAWVNAIRVLSILEYAVNPFIFLTVYRKYFVFFKRVLFGCWWWTKLPVKCRSVGPARVPKSYTSNIEMQVISAPTAS